VLSLCAVLLGKSTYLEEMFIQIVNHTDIQIQATSIALVEWKMP
jgi:hypothetical protein